jgi:hypothetical protein
MEDSMKSPFRCLVQTLAMSCALVIPGFAQITGTGSRAATQAPTSGMITVVPNTPATASLTPSVGTLTTLAGAMDRTQGHQVIMGIKAAILVSPTVATAVKTTPSAAKAEGKATAQTFVENLSDSVIKIEKAPDQSGQVIEKLYTGAKDAGDMTVDPLYQRSQTTLGLRQARSPRSSRS